MLYEAGLLTYPWLERLPMQVHSGLECSCLMKDSQQRVLLVIFTLFPFHLLFKKEPCTKQR
jgi:hypothetical protein